MNRMKLMSRLNHEEVQVNTDGKIYLSFFSENIAKGTYSEDHDITKM